MGSDLASGVGSSHSSVKPFISEDLNEKKIGKRMKGNTCHHSSLARARARVRARARARTRTRTKDKDKDKDKDEDKDEKGKG